MQKHILAQFLTYAGTLPFLAAVMVPIVFPGVFDLDFDYIILTYGAVIASFIAGIHWGIYLLKDSPVNLFIHSNIIALLAWFALWADIPGSPIILFLCFFYALFIDKQLSNADIIEPWYLRMRIIASSIVLSALAIHLWFSAI